MPFVRENRNRGVVIGNHAGYPALPEPTPRFRIARFTVARAASSVAAEAIGSVCGIFWGSGIRIVTVSFGPVDG